ncbi:MAG: tail fiber protein [Flavobacteriales bacterium]|nr:tail fiber protein [Flavobacteriales bacterium]
MNRILFSALFILNYSFLIFNSAKAQAPSKFKYQAVVRDANGAAIPNENVAIRFQLYNAPAGGSLEFQEDFSPVNTGNFGVVNLEVGENPTVGELTTLDWGNSGFYANIQMRPASGGTYTDISDTRSQLVSVPYALYAMSAGSTSEPLNFTGQGATTIDATGYPSIIISSTDENTTYTAGTGIDISSSNQISNTAPNVDQTLSISADGRSLTISGGNTIDLSALVPPGSIQAYGGITAPAGWVMCDGGSYPNTGANAALFAAIGYAFGGSGGSFNVPDFRGRFLRGVDGNAGLDPDKAQRTEMNLGGNSGNLVGSVQGDEFKSHTHSKTLSLTGGGNAIGWQAEGIDIGATIATNPSGGSETRPTNAYVNYIIKL